MGSVQSRASVILHVRRNLEVTAALVGFNTNDGFAKCFLDYWIELGQTEGTNYDNGDLLQAVLDIMAPHLSRKCLPLRNTNYDAFKICFSEVYELLGNSKNTSANYLGIGHGGVPIHIFMPLEGFWRSYEGPSTEKNIVTENGFSNLFPSDVFAHGYKKMGAYLGQDIAQYNCNSSMPVRVGMNQKGLWWNESKVLQFAQRCCYVKYPGCFKAVNSTTSAAENVCESQEACAANATKGHGGGTGYSLCSVT